MPVALEGCLLAEEVVEALITIKLDTRTGVDAIAFPCSSRR
jgi:hypothetical protein